MAPRSVFTGSLGFALVNVPVKIYAATSGHDQGFNLCHVHPDGTGHRINMFRRCSECEAEVAFADLVKGVEREDETMLLISEEELESAEVEAGSGLKILQFADESEIDPIVLESPYFVVPAAANSKKPVDESVLEGYTLIRKVLVAEAKTGVVQYTTRGKTHLATLRPYVCPQTGRETMVLQNMVWNDELRAAEFPVLDRKVEVDPEMYQLATELVAARSGPFDPEKFRDEATIKVQEMIAKKMDGEEITIPEQAEAEAEVGDLLAKLKASVKAQKEAKEAEALEESVGRHPAGRQREVAQTA